MKSWSIVASNRSENFLLSSEELWDMTEKLRQAVVKNMLDCLKKCDVHIRLNGGRHRNCDLENGRGKQQRSQ